MGLAIFGSVASFNVAVGSTDEAHRWEKGCVMLRPAGAVWGCLPEQLQAPKRRSHAPAENEVVIGGEEQVDRNAGFLVALYVCGRSSAAFHRA